MTDTDSDTAQPPPYKTPTRTNSFFTHLNHDVRCLIYDLLDLPPISHESLGLVISCNDAYTETSTAAAWQLNRYLKDKVSAAKQDGYRLMAAPFLLNASFASLQQLTIRVSWRTVKKQYGGLLSVLESRFAKVTIVCMTESELNALEGCGAYKGNLSFEWDKLGEVPESFLRHFMDQMWEDSEKKQSYKYHARKLELAWGDVSVKELRAANELDHICLESRTDAQKFWGAKSATLVDFRPYDEECGTISLQSEGPWEGTLDDTSTFLLDIAWSNAMRVRWQNRELR